MTLSIFLRTSAIVSPSVIDQYGSFPWDNKSDLYKICKQNDIASRLTDQNECLLEGEWHAMVFVFNQIAEYLYDKCNVNADLITFQSLKGTNDQPQIQANNVAIAANGLESEAPDPILLPVNESCSSESITEGVVNQVAEYIKTHTSPAKQTETKERTNQSNPALNFNGDTKVQFQRNEKENKIGNGLSAKISGKRKRNTVTQSTLEKTKYAIVTRKQRLLGGNISADCSSPRSKKVRVQKIIKDKIDCKGDCIDVNLSNSPQKHPQEHTKFDREQKMHSNTDIQSNEGQTSSLKMTIKRRVKIKKEEYSCQDCPFTTMKKANLNIHEKQIHGKETLSCATCGKVCNSRRSLSQHEKSHLEGPNYCEICGKFYKGRRTLEQHKKSHEKSYIKPEFECKTCKKIFSTKYVLKEHVKSQHLGIKKQFLCPTCGKSFTQKNSYIQHANVHIGLKPFQCEHCGKSFAYEKSLKEHRFLHDDVLHFKCDICGKLFRQSASLQIHQKIHKEVKDFLCGTCGKGFTQKQAIVRHMRIHDGTKPFSCGLCTKTFNDASIIRRHMILVHKKDSKEWREDVTFDLAEPKEYWIWGKKPDKVISLLKSKMTGFQEISEKINHVKSNPSKESNNSKLVSYQHINSLTKATADKNVEKDSLSNGRANFESKNDDCQYASENILPSSLPDKNTEESDFFTRKNATGLKTEGSDILLHSPSISQYIHSTADTNVSVSLDQSFDNFTHLQDRKSDDISLTFPTSLPSRSESQWTAEPLPYTNVHYISDHHFTNYQNQ